MLTGFLPGGAKPSQPLPWPTYAEVRTYDASPGFVASAVHLMAQANIDLATESTIQVIDFY